MIECKICKNIKNENLFYIEKRVKSGRTIVCIECCKKRNKERTEKFKLYFQTHSVLDIGTKECFKCKKIKDVSEFYKGRHRGGDGLYPYCKECSYAEYKINYNKNRNKKIYQSKKYKYLHFAETLLNNAKNRAKRKNLSFSLKIEDIKIPNICPVLGIKIIIDIKDIQTKWNSPSIDRINNSKGYDKENVIITSWKANHLKGNSSVNEMRNVYNFYKNIINYKYKEEHVDKNLVKIKISQMINGAKARAKYKNIIFNLKKEDIFIPSICPILNIPLVLNYNDGFHPNSASLDRIDNSKGYTKDNVIVISWRANEVKKEANLEEIEKLINFYEKFKQ